MQTTLSALTLRLNAEDARQRLREKGVTYTDAKGNKSNFDLPATGETTPLGLVTYILASPNNPNALEFHLAWEMALSNAPIKIAYIDAVNGEIVATE
jgi:hypothetical protein